jgi:DNA-binding MurR/RpiR family transcriptional regulator
MGNTLVDLAPDPWPVPQVLERIRAALPGFSPAERRVADAVLLDPVRVPQCSIAELADDASTSSATVVRLCASVGLSGFQELKIALARECAVDDRLPDGDVGVDDSIAVVATKVLGATARSVDRAARAIDVDALELVVDAVCGARRIVFAAVGSSAPLALDAAYRMVTLGRDASFAPDVHMQHLAASGLGEDDVLIAISHSGESAETIASVRAAQTAGARTVALTSFGRCTLADTADVVLVAGSPGAAYRVEAMVSRVVHFALLDAVFVAVAHRGSYSPSALARAEDALAEHRA